MSLRLHCKRSKIFIRHDGDRAQQVLCGRDKETVVPDWVKDDIGYKMGLKDGSIVDLTPPSRHAIEEEPEEASPIETEPGESEEGEEPEAAAPAPKKPAKSNVPKGLQTAGTVIKTR